LVVLFVLCHIRRVVEDQFGSLDIAFRRFWHRRFGARVEDEKRLQGEIALIKVHCFFIWR
jgi:hypothetical protein